MAEYAKILELQEGIYPANYIKLRFAENHDQPRLAHLLPNPTQRDCWTAFLAFLPGAFLIYGGQETGTDHLPNLFEKDVINWPRQPSVSHLLSRLTALKKDTATDGHFDILERDTHFQARWQHAARQLYGIFNVRGIDNTVPVQLPDGSYTNLLDDTPLTVSNGQINLPKYPVIVSG